MYEFLFNRLKNLQSQYSRTENLLKNSEDTNRKLQRDKDELLTR